MFQRRLGPSHDVIQRFKAIYLLGFGLLKICLPKSPSSVNLVHGIQNRFVRLHLRHQTVADDDAVRLHCFGELRFDLMSKVILGKERAVQIHLRDLRADHVVYVS